MNANLELVTSSRRRRIRRRLRHFDTFPGASRHNTSACLGQPPIPTRAQTHAHIKAPQTIRKPLLCEQQPHRRHGTPAPRPSPLRPAPACTRRPYHLPPTTTGQRVQWQTSSTSRSSGRSWRRQARAKQPLPRRPWCMHAWNRHQRSLSELAPPARRARKLHAPSVPCRTRPAGTPAVLPPGLHKRRRACPCMAPANSLRLSATHRSNLARASRT